MPAEVADGQRRTAAAPLMLRDCSKGIGMWKFIVTAVAIMFLFGALVVIGVTAMIV